MTTIRFKHISAAVLISFSTLIPLSFALADLSTTEVTTRIQKVLLDDAEPKAFSTVDGRVYSIFSKNPNILKQLNAAVASSEPVRLVIVGDEIVTVRPTTVEERARFSDAFVANAEETVRSLTEPPTGGNITDDALMYLPTVLGSTADAERLYRRLDWNVRHQSQCYQRAHYWAYSMWNNASIKSMKVFLFFTRKYIRDYRYKWWFHVAPFVYAGGFEMVLDPEFTNHATQLNTWSHYFVRHPQNCQVASSYREYEQGEWLHYCYVRKVPMYNYQPLDVQFNDRNRTERTGWVAWELNNSRCAKLPCF